MESDNMDCLFCKIVDGSIPSKKIYEDDTVLAFLDINPDSMGHTLIIPKKHFKDITDIDETLNHIFEVAKMLKIKLEEKLGCDGVTFIQNNGDVQEIKHFHLHLKPYYKENKNLDIEKVYELLS
jgi:histidine triad (HIT) family protein